MSEPDYTAHVRRLSTPELIRWVAGWREGSHPRLIGEHELQRRRDHSQNLRGWIAIVLSVAALTVSLLALFRK